MRTLIFLGLVGLFSAFIFYIFYDTFRYANLKRQITVMLAILLIMLSFSFAILLLQVSGLYAKIPKMEKGGFPISQLIILNLTVFLFSQITVAALQKSKNKTETFHKWLESFMIPLGSLLICYIGSRDWFCTWKDANTMMMVGISILSFNAGSYLFTQKRNLYSVQATKRQQLKQFKMKMSIAGQKTDGLQTISEYIQTTQIQWKNLARVRHDLRNSYILEMGYLEKGRIDLLRKHYENHIGILENAQVICTQNIGIDCILNYKVMIARKNGIRTNFEIRVSNEIRILYEDLNALLGNLLDNAIEAAVKVEQKKREIFFKLSSDSTALLFQIRNTCDGKCRQDENGYFISHKGDMNNHGIGLQVVREIVNVYNGKMEITSGNTDFQVTVFLLM